jgi:hypothetical protein
MVAGLLHAEAEDDQVHGLFNPLHAMWGLQRDRRVTKNGGPDWRGHLQLEAIHRPLTATERCRLETRARSRLFAEQFDCWQLRRAVFDPPSATR